jgi:hypothetical protein
VNVTGPNLIRVIDHSEFARIVIHAEKLGYSYLEIEIVVFSVLFLGTMLRYVLELSDISFLKNRMLRERFPDPISQTDDYLFLGHIEAEGLSIVSEGVELTGVC